MSFRCPRQLDTVVADQPRTIQSSPLQRVARCTTNQENHTYLVTVSPEVVLRPDVLVRILDALLKRGLVGPMLPMLIPQPPGIDTTENERRNHNVDAEFAPEICAKGSRGQLSSIAESYSRLCLGSCHCGFR